MKKEYASQKLREAWLRHPVLGDPSFDTFERLGEPVHVSKPPFEWTVNCSLFRDFDGSWYCYTGLYHFGYLGGEGGTEHFKIYRSKDEGQSWEDLGRGFEPGFTFSHLEGCCDSSPDVVLCYDEKRKKYLLTYDTGCEGLDWEANWSGNYGTRDSGAALAWADTPAGPFHRLDALPVSNRTYRNSLGHWSRMYASNVIPRKDDYIWFVLNDSHGYYSWGLAAMTAPTPEGPWSAPHQLLCCERPDYYPAPCEFFPVQLIDGVCYAPGTSVARNRNYQFTFAAPLEKAHLPSAWKMTADGDVWHAQDRDAEYAGIWGQTFHGFVEPDTRRYVVAFPSKNKEDLGTINLAARPYDRPFSDGFVLTAHEASAMTVLYAAYADFELEAEFNAKGCVDFAFDFEGVLGAKDCAADCEPVVDPAYSAVRVEENRCSVLHHGTVLQQVSLAQKITSLHLVRQGCRLKAEANGRPLLETELPCAAQPCPPALVLAPHSRLDCSRFDITGREYRWHQHRNVMDGLLGAGCKYPKPELTDTWQRTENGVQGEGRLALKWNVICDGFTVRCTQGTQFGELGVWLDGLFLGAARLYTDNPDFTLQNLEYGRHAVRVEPLNGKVEVLGLDITGPGVPEEVKGLRP